MKLFHLCLIQSYFSWVLLWITLSQGQFPHSHTDSDSQSESTISSLFFYQQPKYPRDCREVYDQCLTNSSGVYLIKPDGHPDPFEAYCDNNYDDGGWTIFQRRIAGILDFQRNWTEYKTGFGFLNHEFWLGFDKLSFLTNQKDYELRIDMKNAAGSHFYIEYNLFRVSDEWSNYVLSGLGKHKGTTDSFITVCPPNTEYGNCTCQATCEDPDGKECVTACSEENICLCGEGFLKKGDDCVPIEECSCFFEGQVIPNGQTNVNADCTRRCQCQSNVLTCDDNYGCSSDATCEEIGGVRQCYCNDGYTGDGQNCDVIGIDCADIYNAGYTDSAVYTINPRNWPGSPFEVYCNMTDGGGWTVFQRRVNGSENFYLGWDSYKDGFGSPDHELWLGNDKIYYMTNQKNYQLRIDLVNRDGSPLYATYDLFRINNEADNYRLANLGSYSGNTGYDAMNFHRNRPFSTFDRDNDQWNTYHCAERQVGAWWYGEFDFYSNSNCRTSPYYCEHWQEGANSCGRCSHANLNGDYDGSARGTNLHWRNLAAYECNIKFTEMKIKPI